ncbi:hypothetical protein ACDZ29_20590 [Peribacillus sp. RS7]
MTEELFIGSYLYAAIGAGKVMRFLVESDLRIEEINTLLLISS